MLFNWLELNLEVFAHVVSLFSLCVWFERKDLMRTAGDWPGYGRWPRVGVSMPRRSFFIPQRVSDCCLSTFIKQENRISLEKKSTRTNESTRWSPMELKRGTRAKRVVIKLRSQPDTHGTRSRVGHAWFRMVRFVALEYIGETDVAAIHWLAGNNQSTSRLRMQQNKGVGTSLLEKSWI